MPCYLFTYHSYGSWMPDRKRGYVKRHRGILGPDTNTAAKYRLAMKDAAVELDGCTQIICIDTILESREKQKFEVYFIAINLTHVHLLVGWKDERAWLPMRSIIKSSLSRTLNDRLQRRTWFVEGGSRKRVKDRTHFDHLIAQYLPKHRGWKWSPARGRFR